MDMSVEAATIFALLLPGFIASRILSAILIRKEQPNLDKIIEAFVLSFVIYAVAYGILGLASIESGEANLPRMVIRRDFVGIALGLSVLVPLTMGVIFRHDLHMKVLRKLRVTEKTSRDTTWLDVFATQDRYVICNLASGRRIFGWPMFYSTTPEEGLIYLYDPAWVKDEEYLDLDDHGILLSGHDPIESIEFTTVTAKNARETRNART